MNKSVFICINCKECTLNKKPSSFDKWFCNLRKKNISNVLEEQEWCPRL